MTSSGWERKTGVYAASVAFALLAAILAGLEAISVSEAMWASASVALAFVPTGWWGSAGFRRRAAEAALLPAAFALTMVGGAAMRWMLVPPLLLIAAWTAFAAAWERTPAAGRPLLAAFLGLSARAAVGLGLIGFSAFATGVTVVLAAVAPWAAARRSGRRAAELAALGAAVIPWQRWPVPALVVVAACAAWGVLGRGRSRDEVVLRWLPGVGAAALLAASLAPWAGFPVSEIFPGHSWLAPAVVVLALIITPRLRPGAAGAVWLLATLSLGPALAPPPEQRAFVLTEELGELRMSAGSGGPYVIDVAVRNGGDLEDDVPFAVLRYAGVNHLVRAGLDGGTVVWRPRGTGQSARWRPAVRRTFAVPAGERPVLYRHQDLPDEVEVRVETLGTVRATPPRNWTLPAWLLAAALAVVVTQALSGSWRQPVAALPWIPLILGSLIARAPIEPLRLLGERLAVDIALAAVLLAWLPAARRWLGQRRVFVTVVALLVPLALATPHLTPPLYGDEPFHLLVMDSLTTDHDLHLADDLDLEHQPGNALYAPGWPLFHSPVLGALLLPGYLLAGRAGALVLLALMGGALAALIARRARALGLIEARVGLLVLLLAATYPVATFATQIWPELPGALAVAALLVLVAGPRGGRWLGLVIAVGAAAIKTRLGLLTFPIAAVAWLRRARVRGLVMLGAAIAGAGDAGGSHRRRPRHWLADHGPPLRAVPAAPPPDPRRSGAGGPGPQWAGVRSSGRPCLHRTAAAGGVGRCGGAVAPRRAGGARPSHRRRTHPGGPASLERVVRRRRSAGAVPRAHAPGFCPHRHDAAHPAAGMAAARPGAAAAVGGRVVGADHPASLFGQPGGRRILARRRIVAAFRRRRPRALPVVPGSKYCDMDCTFGDGPHRSPRGVAGDSFGRCGGGHETELDRGVAGGGGRFGADSRPPV